MSDKNAEPGRGLSFLTAAAATRRRQKRLEELSKDRLHKDIDRRLYAIRTLISLLWVAPKNEDFPIACVLLGHAPVFDRERAPVCAVRLSEKIPRTETTIISPPPTELSAQKAWLAQGINAIVNEALDNLRQMAKEGKDIALQAIARETETCRDALQLAQTLYMEQVAEVCIRILHQFTIEFGRESGTMARQTTILRDTASKTLGVTDPDSLTPLWNALGSPDARQRRNLLPMLDYLSDSRAIPYLVNLLENRGRSGDSEMLGWFIVRAFERIGDRNALPALRRLAAPPVEPDPELGETPLLSASPELAREARRVIQAIEGGKDSHERNLLLRPAEPLSQNLLRPAGLPDANTERDRHELLRPDDEPLRRSEE